MRSKTKIVVAILAIAVIVGGAIFAYTQYFAPEEEEVPVATITTGFDTSGSSTSADLSVQQNYGAGNESANVQVQNMSQEQYRNRWRNRSGNATMKQTKGKGEQGADVSVRITFNLTLPNGTKKTFTFNPPQSKGTGGKKEFKSVMGPNELNNTTGTFHLSISIHVTVTPPNMDEPVVDKELTPVDKTFTIPKEGEEEGTETEEVSVASVTTGFDIDGSTTSTSVRVQAEDYTASNPNASVQERNMSRDRYRNRWRNRSGNATMKQTQGKNGTGGANVSVEITFTLQFPNETNKTFSFNPPQSSGVGRKEFQGVLGPGELENTTGTFTLWITIHVTVTPPKDVDVGGVDKTLGPIEKTFTIPETEA